jgi:Bifunctional DNA primase/polymerase, N-terminal
MKQDHVTSTEKLTAAVELAQHGWPVFPCRGKVPMTKHGHLDATTDQDQARELWMRYPHANIGAAVPPSLAVFDIDPRNGGSFDALTAIVGPLPQTLTAWSGRGDGGRHLYFLRPHGELTSTKLPLGIDLKAYGYCVMPPSLHPATGQPYRWELAHMPHALRELLRPAARPVLFKHNAELRRRTGSSVRSSGARISIRSRTSKPLARSSRIQSAYPRWKATPDWPA